VFTLQTGISEYIFHSILKINSQVDGMRRESTMTSDEARTLLYQWVESASLRKHCESVAASMEHMALKFGEKSDLWKAVGLLHDFDYEKHPTLEEHPMNGVKHLREIGVSEVICKAILSHGNHTGVPRETPMEKSLFAVDELSGFVTACTLVKPSKNIADVSVESVKKKMKDKAFARQVSREDIIQGAEELAMPLETVIGDVIEAMQKHAALLELDGRLANAN
jgi:putative nucleotidyltransferase with HDIG domain